MAIVDRIFGEKKRSLELDDPSEYNDCVSCRVFGSVALVSMGGYTYFSGMKQLRERSAAIERSRSKYKTGSRRLGVITLSATLIGLGLYRTVN